MKNQKIEVSVICLTYNHRNYIEDALNSIIKQKTNFTYELIVHDDMSTDGTTEIIKRYEKKYPDIVKPIYEYENQWSKGRDVLVDLIFPYAKGKYIALCEGDDYWTDDLKLQKQYDLMEQHPEVDACACAAKEVADNEDGSEQVYIRPKKENTVLSAEEVILGGGRYLATASLFFRKNIVDSMMKFEKVLFFDYSLQIRSALRGGIYYLDSTMAVYRRNIEGSWTMEVEKNREKHAAHVKKEIAMLRQLDVDTNGMFHETIEQRICAYTSFFDQLMNCREQIEQKLPMEAHARYLWGLGMRGDAFQEFCKREKVELDGVCDLKNQNIGDRTSQGYTIVPTDFVLDNSDVIFASNEKIYNALLKTDYRGQVINLQPFMPLS